MILCFLGAVQRRERPLQAGLLIGAAMLARHVGVVGLGAIGLWWLLRWELPLRQRVAAVGWLGLGALPGPGLWWLYLRVAGTPDVREDTRVCVLENARDFFTSLGQNVLNVDPAWPDLGLGLGLGVWVGALALVLSRVERGRATEVEEVIGIFVLLYPPFVIMASSMTVVAILGARFVNPLLPPLALMLGAGLASLSRPKGVALLLVPLWLSAAVKVQNYREQGLGGISTPVFQEAVLLEKIKEVRDEELWSNRPDLLALLWDRPVRLAAQKHPFRRPHQDAGGLRSLEGALQRGPVYMVWFNQSPGRDWYFYSPEQLGRAGYGVELLAEAEEGSLVLLSPAWLSEIREGEE